MIHVKELIERLKKLPDNAIVALAPSSDCKPCERGEIADIILEENPIGKVIVFYPE